MFDAVYAGQLLNASNAWIKLNKRRMSERVNELFYVWFIYENLI